VVKPKQPGSLQQSPTLTGSQESRSVGDLTKEFYVTSAVHENETLRALCLQHAQEFKTEELVQKDILAQQYESSFSANVILGSRRGWKKSVSPRHNGIKL
jgi:hypothetical protein